MGFKIVPEKEITAAIGIGAMIVFIAMVLIAGIAASVFIQTANKLEITSMESGSQTTDEVSAGLKVVDIEGKKATAWHYNPGSGSAWSNNSITNMTLSVTPRAGSPEIDLSTTVLEISNSNIKCILSYNTGEPEFVASVPAGGVFASVDGTTNIFAQDANTFGIIELEDADDSCDADTPVLNRGDMVMVCVNASACFGGCAARTDVWGTLYPEGGSVALFSFQIPGLGSDTVFDLY